MATSTATNNVWYLWNDVDTTSTATTADVWTRWVTVAEGLDAPAIIEQRERWRQEQAEAEQRIFDARREARDAEARAEALLLSCLSLRQREEYRQHKHFVVHGRNGMRYRIRPGRVGNVDVVDRHGRLDHRLCFHPDELLPVSDVMLVQKLMLEDDEKDVRKIANVHQVDYAAHRELILPALH